MNAPDDGRLAFADFTQDVKDDGQARAIARLTTGYVLRTIGMVAALFDNDLILAMVFLTIISANLAYLDQGAGDDAILRGLNQSAPDDLRRPISMLSVSHSLKLPYETARRYVRKLIALEVCEAKRGGVFIPAKILQMKGHAEGLVDNAANLRRLIRDLRRAGVEF